MMDVVDLKLDTLEWLLVSREIGMYKKENNMPVLQTGRYNEILEKRAQMGEAMNLDRDFVNAIMKSIHEESVRIQLAL